MSDELTSELAAELGELAAAGETPPPLSGAEIRGRAVRRRRHRRTIAAVAGASAAAALALIVVLNLSHGGTDRHPAPAATPTAPPSTPATADATVDLARRVIRVAGRELPLSSGAERTPTAAGRMTVTTRASEKRISASDLALGEEYEVKVPWVIELRASDGRTNFIAGLTYDVNAPGNADHTTGWIGLRESDAEWLYRELGKGAVVDIQGAAPAPTAPLS